MVITADTGAAPFAERPRILCRVPGEMILGSDGALFFDVLRSDGSLEECVYMGACPEVLRPALQKWQQATEAGIW